MYFTFLMMLCLYELLFFITRAIYGVLSLFGFSYDIIRFGQVPDGVYFSQKGMAVLEQVLPNIQNSLTMQFLVLLLIPSLLALISWDIASIIKSFLLSSDIPMRKEKRPTRAIINVSYVFSFLAIYGVFYGVWSIFGLRFTGLAASAIPLLICLICLALLYVSIERLHSLDGMVGCIRYVEYVVKRTDANNGFMAGGDLGEAVSINDMNISMTNGPLEERGMSAVPITKARSLVRSVEEIKESGQEMRFLDFPDTKLGALIAVADMAERDFFCGNIKRDAVIVCRMFFASLCSQRRLNSVAQALAR